jgi:hypothetical protein
MRFVRFVEGVKYFLVLILLLHSAVLNAAELVCSGTVDELSYHASNRFMLRLSSMNVAVFFCNPDAEWIVSGTGYKTGPNACKMMYSTFLAAKATGKRLTSMYFDGDDVPASCDGFENWKSVNIRHYKFL